jgi:hypothetical protein
VKNNKLFCEKMQTMTVNNRKSCKKEEMEIPNLCSVMLKYSETARQLVIYFTFSLQMSWKMSDRFLDE